MIKITKGFYGVKRLNSKSAPFSLSDAEEARLVKLGVAEYVTDVPAVNAIPGFEYTPETAGVNPAPAAEKSAPKTAGKAKAKKAGK